MSVSSTPVTSVNDWQAFETALLSLQSASAEALAQSRLHRLSATAQIWEYLRRLNIMPWIHQTPPPPTPPAAPPQQAQQTSTSSLPHPHGPLIMHVAGTKGKGSTCAFVERLLRDHGLRTGLYTSPHLLKVNERFRINGTPVSH
jgi:hypothetical protein